MKEQKKVDINEVYDSIKMVLRPAITFDMWKPINRSGEVESRIRNSFNILQPRFHNLDCFANDYLSPNVYNIIRKSIFEDEISWLFFIKIKIKELGFTRQPTTLELLNHKYLSKLELGLCKPSDGLYVIYHSNGWNDDYNIGMKPLNIDGYPSIFSTQHSGGGKTWLGEEYACPKKRWNLESEFVFRYMRYIDK